MNDVTPPSSGRHRRMLAAPLRSPWLGLVFGTAAGLFVTALGLALYGLAVPYPEGLTGPDGRLAGTLTALTGLRPWQLLVLPTLALQFAATSVWLLRDCMDRDGHAREALQWVLRAWRVPVYGALGIGAWLIVQDSYVAFLLGAGMSMRAAGFVMLMAGPLLVPLFAWQRRVLEASRPAGWWIPGWPGVAALAGYVACEAVAAGVESGLTSIDSAFDASTTVLAITVAIDLSAMVVLQTLQARLWLLPQTSIRARLAGAFDRRLLAAAGWWALAVAALATPFLGMFLLTRMFTVYVLPQIDALRTMRLLPDAWWGDLLSQLQIGTLAWLYAIGSLMTALSYGRMIVRSADAGRSPDEGRRPESGVQR